MRALWKLRHGFEEFCDLVLIGREAIDRQAEGRFAYEHFALYRFEGRAGGIAPALEVARDDDRESLPFERDLCGAKHVSCGEKTNGDAIARDLLAVADRFARAGEALAHARLHDREPFSGGDDGAVARARVIRMAMGDE